MSEQLINNKKRFHYYQTSDFGLILLESDSKGITGLRFVKNKDESIVETSSLIFDKTIKYLDEYFNGNRPNPDFSISLDHLSINMQRLFRILLDIPMGEVVTYKDVSDQFMERYSHKSSPRAVGQLLGRNPIPVLVPCHRVVGKDSIGGFSLGLEMKRKLLLLEGIDLEKY